MTVIGRSIVTYKGPCAYTCNISCRLKVPMVLQCQFSCILSTSNCGGFLIVLYRYGDCLLEYLTDCSIRVSQSCLYYSWGLMCPSLDLPLLLDKILSRWTNQLLQGPHFVYFLVDQAGSDSTTVETNCSTDFCRSID